MKRAALAMAAGVALVLLAAVPAYAQDYPPVVPEGFPDSGQTVDPGDPVSLTIPPGGCAPNESLAVTVANSSGKVLDTTTVTTDAEGGAKINLTAPGDPGTYFVVASDTCVFEGSFHVRGTTTRAGALAFTGSNTWPFVGIGVALLLFGAGLVFYGRKRRAARLTG